jgi:hypothetical protein
MILRPSRRPPRVVAPGRCRKDIAENGKTVGWHFARPNGDGRVAIGQPAGAANSGRRGLFLAIHPIKKFPG